MIIKSFELFSPTVLLGLQEVTVVVFHRCAGRERDMERQDVRRHTARLHQARLGSAKVCTIICIC
jgi:hypothetical protein